jgi:hypothetical protein
MRNRAKVTVLLISGLPFSSLADSTQSTKPKGTVSILEVTATKNLKSVASNITRYYQIGHQPMENNGTNRDERK